MEELSEENLENPENIAVLFQNVLHNVVSISPDRLLFIFVDSFIFLSIIHFYYFVYLLNLLAVLCVKKVAYDNIICKCFKVVSKIFSAFMMSEVRDIFQSIDSANV